MQIMLLVVKMNEDKKNVRIYSKKRVIIELIFMAIIGTLVILPLSLYAYHFLIWGVKKQWIDNNYGNLLNWKNGRFGSILGWYTGQVFLF